jgi:hypothetical protein
MKYLRCLVLLLLVVTPVFCQTSPPYFYVVTAIGSNGTESVFSNQISVTFAQGQHNVNLTWVASTSTVTGYNIYRGTVTGGPYTKINASPVTVVTYTDTFTLPNAPTGLAATVS